MDTAALDSYLLEGVPDKASLVKRLLEESNPLQAARPYLEGFRTLGARTPDLALIALRLAVAGKRGDDDTIVRFRGLVDRARRGGPDGDVAKAEYRSEFA